MTTAYRERREEKANHTLVLVLSGGTSTERDVSLQSGQAVLGALQTSIESGALDAEVKAVFVDPDGRWSCGDAVLSESEFIKSLPSNAVIFNALHGGRGEGGGIQRALEEASVPYTGSGPTASALCMDKNAARQELMGAGLECARGALVTALPKAPGELKALTFRLNALNPEGHGWFVKPNEGGSSAGVRKIDEIKELLPSIAVVLSGGESALIEAAVPGVELSAGVLGNAQDKLLALTPVEIQPQSVGWFDEAEKYDEEGGALEACPPENVPTEVLDDLKKSAVLAHRATGCHGYSRTDFIYSTDGQLIVLEVNTLPGLTPRSLLPLEAEADGFSFPELCLTLLTSAEIRLAQ